MITERNKKISNADKVPFISAKKDIDFVLTWVDDTDPRWQKERQKYQEKEDTIWNRNEVRYRDWGTLRYWFRSVERYAPWVRKIHFVTCGHYPKWLNFEHPKLHFVKHEDFIPHQYLPTFNVNPIELNLHRIEGLSEQFVFFNDDMFVFAPVKPTDFFVNSLPCDSAIRCFPLLGEIGHINMNDINLINRKFYFRRQYNQNFWKWNHPKYGFRCLKNLYFLPWGDFTGAVNTHVANSYTKESYEQVWECFGEELHVTCTHKFRTSKDVNQWLIKYWQLVMGNFHPRRTNFGKFYLIDNLNGWEKDLKKKRHSLVCLNDNEECTDISELKEKVNRIFEEEFPEKCSYENKI